MSPPGGRAQPLTVPGRAQTLDAVMWNEEPVKLSLLDMIFQPVISIAICVGLMGRPSPLRAYSVT